MEIKHSIEDIKKMEVHKDSVFQTYEDFVENSLIKNGFSVDRKLKRWLFGESKLIVLIGNDDDIYKVVFFDINLNYITIELKASCLIHGSLKKRDVDYFNLLAKGELSRFCGSHAMTDYAEEVLGLDNKKIIRVKDAYYLLKSSKPEMYPITEKIRVFCLNIILKQ